jgi:predicted GTPase
LKDYKLIVHCGGCMLTRKAMQVRIKQAKFMNVPIVNYGVAISYMHGAMPRAIEIFEDAISEWNNKN